MQAESAKRSNALFAIFRAGYVSVLLLWVLGSYGSLLFQWYRLDQSAANFPQWIETMDFVPFYCMGVLAKQAVSHHLNMYDPSNQLMVINQVLSPHSISKPPFVPYPPYFFVLMIPFTVLGLTKAWLLWSGTAVILIIITAWLVAGRCFADKFSCLTTVLYTLACHPVWWATKSGNTAIWLFPLISFWWLSLSSGAYLRSGIQSWVALIKVQYLPVLSIPGIFLGRQVYFCGLVVAGLILSVPAVVLLGWENIVGFIQGAKIGETPGVYGYNPNLYQNVKGSLWFLSRSETPIDNVISIAALVLGLALLVWFWRPARRDVIDQKIVLSRWVATTLLTGLVISLHTYKQDYTIASFCCILMWKWLTEDHSARKGMRLVLSVLLLFYPALSWLFFFAGGNLMNLGVQPYFLWAVCTLMCAMLTSRTVAAEFSLRC